MVWSKQNKRGRANLPKEISIVLLHEYGPLVHQLLPIFLGLPTAHSLTSPLRNYAEDFDRKLRKCRICIRTVHSLHNPLTLLGCNIRGRGDSPSRINQKEDEDFLVTRFCRVLQVEWLNQILIQVREYDASMGLGDDITDLFSQFRVPNIY